MNIPVNSTSSQLRSKTSMMKEDKGLKEMSPERDCRRGGKINEQAITSECKQDQVEMLKV